MTTEQRNLLEVLHVFSDLCRRYSLRYFLCGGTLLGAVRHQGFIPWDDDIDILMPIDDYRAFIQLAMTELPEGYVLQSQETDENFPFLFAKICDTANPFDNGMEYRPLGLFIDIFPIAFCKKPNRLRNLMFNINLLITQTLQMKTGWTVRYHYRNPVVRFGYGLLHRLRPKTLKRIRQFLIDRICVSYQTPDICSIGGIYKAPTEFPKSEWLSSAVPVEFEGFQFPAPTNWDAYLTNHYGADYMTPPPEAQRLSHKV